MQGRFFLDVVVRKRAAVFKLLPRKDQTLLVWGNAFFVLDFLLHVVDGIAGFHIESDCLPCQSLDEDLHSAEVRVQDECMKCVCDVCVTCV